MRRVLVPVMVAVGLAGAATGSAYAQDPSPPAGAAPATPGEPVCTIDDSRLRELSGMAATANGYVVVNDSTDIGSRERVFLLNRKCNVREAVQYGGNGPRDPEDLALSPDKKFVWIADIGDNGADRETVALWRMPVDGSDNPQIYRLSYPDGAKDAEALLIGADGQPVIITKGAKAVLYKPSAELKKGTTTPLQKVGELTLPKTSTGNPLGPAGRVAVTGAAAAPDGSRVVLRTYADAFEWDVTGGDVVAALTTGKPRITPLPDEPWGEAISYTVDGVAFLTVSETAQQEGLDAEILRYTPAKAAPPAAAANGGGTAAEDTRSFLDKLDLGDITLLIGAVGVLGVLLVGAGVIGIVRARRRAPELDDLDDDVPARGAAQVAGPATEILARPRAVAEPPYGRAAVGADGGVYGAARPAGPAYGAAAAGAVYGANRSGAYDGGERDGGAVYGAGYRAGRDADEQPPPYRGGGYGGRQPYDGYPDDRYPDDRYGGNGYDGNGYPDDGYRDDGYRGNGYAQQPAGGPPRGERGYRYDEPDY